MDDNFPFGDFVDKHFNAEKECEAFKAWGLENCAQVMLEDSVRWVCSNLVELCVLVFVYG